MRFLLTLPCFLSLAVMLGCGEGYENRKAPPPGASDPTSIIQELEPSQPDIPAAPEKTAEEQPAAEQSAAEEPAAPAKEAEEKPAENANP